MAEHLLEVRNLKKYFDVGGGNVLHAVDNVSFYINEGETFGLVGESGCGKTTAGRTLLGIYEATDGQVLFDGKDITHVKGKARRELSDQMQMIFQDPYGSLDPRMTVEEIITEGWRVHHMYTKEERRERALHLLELVGLNREHASRYPHEFSGGQRQRVGIARALALNPRFIVCDEPTSALDVSVQAQVINLLQRLQAEQRLTYLFISHDLSTVKLISDRIGVMYMGALVEVADSEELYRNPLHPYTQALLSAIPVLDPVKEKQRERIKLPGEPSNPINTDEHCKFRSRCPYADTDGNSPAPHLIEITKGHWVACTRAEGLMINTYSI